VGKTARHKREKAVWVPSALNPFVATSHRLKKTFFSKLAKMFAYTPNKSAYMRRSGPATVTFALFALNAPFWILNSGF